MNKKLLAILGVVAIAVAGVLFMNQTGSSANAETTAAANEDLPDYLADRVMGEADALVTIVEYANFTCSHCGDFHRTVFDQLKTEYIDTGKVKLVYREVIADGPGVLATSLARCLPENQYFGMASMLYTNQQEWAYSQESLDGVKAQLTKYANLAGLSKDDLNACFDDTAKQEEMLDNSRKNAEADKVQGTPTLILNGKTVKNWAWPELKAEIEAALK